MAAAEIIEKLTRHGKTVAVAESCTGGMICSMLVEQVGASACFAEGYVTYSNEAKEKNLGVSHEVLEACGAVSEQTARQMAEGNYDIVFTGRGYKEITQLNDTMNHTTRKLKEVDQMRRDLIANVSHDLRTPLTMITGYAEVMRDLPGENTPENVQVIIDEANRLTTLVNDMLDLSKMQAGAQKLSPSFFDLTESVRDILGRYNKLTDYHISFTADRDVTVYADELKISQVVYNLVNNAITYTGEDKVVRLRQTEHDGKVRIEVRDTGEGIEQDKLKDIWERYYKVDKAHKRAQIGTGLGLSIVKTILDMHGGAYGVQSEQGVGSTFWFELDVQGDSVVEAPKPLSNVSR